MSIKFEEYMIIPTTSVSINANGTYSVVDKASAIVNVQQYTEISTAEGMEAVKIDANHGNIYKYVGTSTSTYINGRFYIVQRSQTHTNTLSGVGNYPFVSSSVLTLDPNIYDGPYESSGTTDSNQSVARIDTTGYKSITIWINSFAESIYDYTILSDLNADTYPTSGSGDKSTSGFQHDPRNGLNVDNWKKITYELTENQNHFFIVYRKDGSASSNDDKGYFVLECHDSQNASFIEYMPIPTSSITINANGSHNVLDKATAIVQVPNMEEVSTEAEMNAKKINANIGNIYKFVGTSTQSYKMNDLYIAKMIPTKGQIITMNLGNAAPVSGLNNQYRVLNVDGDIISVIAMYETISEVYYGNNYARYAGAELDTHLNNTWYSTLSQEAKNAIIPTNLNAYEYQASDDVLTSTHASKANYSTKVLTYNIGDRYIYAIDIEDLESYFDNEFSITDLKLFFWNSENPSQTTMPWFRSEIRGDYGMRYGYILSNEHYIKETITMNQYAARPAFRFDLRKISYT